ncbi:MAG: hypothetical protein JWR21_2668 [Herminiimonas sp.]|nr:hypothetical protein [Herminiimonas sp.]MDB5855932.1 hypothetical protein [Herminiimonas sp.]
MATTDQSKEVGAGSAATGARAVDALLEAYSVSHRNHTNELIHVVCVPAIAFSFLGLLWAVHPLAAFLVVALSLVYYARLSVPLALGMLLMSGAMLVLLALIPPSQLVLVSVVVFVVAWIGQFIGHAIEGRKPSFFDDLRFLLIGPLFVLGFLYRRARIAY